MYRLLFLTFTGLLLIAILCGCSSHGHSNPVQPDSDLQNPLTLTKDCALVGSPTHLGGYYNISIDPETWEVKAFESRHALFTANLTNILNNSMMGMTFNVNDVIAGTHSIDVDIDIGINHPFPGYPEFAGYDLRCVFMGNGSGILETGNVKYPVPGTDQYMLTSVVTSHGGPDGYSRWYNFTEFSEGSSPLFSFTPSILSSPGFAGTATLCPYKYFADGIGTYDHLWSWLNDHADQYGVFSQSSNSVRNFFIRFPMPEPGLQFSLAVIFDWAGVEPEFHPANTTEAVACSIVDKSNLYYETSVYSGGDINLDISLWDWDNRPSDIYVESEVLSGVYKFTPEELVPSGGNENYSTWSVELPADNIKDLTEKEIWIIAEYDGYTYANILGVPNLVEDEPLRAYFKHQLVVSSSGPDIEPVCDLEVVTPMPASGYGSVDVEFDATASYDPDGSDANLIFEWDFDGDAVFGEDPDDIYSGGQKNPTHTYTETYKGDVNLRITDEDGLVTNCQVQVDVTVLSDENLDPICELTVVTELPAEGWDAGTPVQFDASGTTDPDGDDLLLTYEWDFDEDLVFGDSFEGDQVTPTHYYTFDYVGVAAVRVSDDEGGESTCHVDVQVITHQSKNIPVDDEPHANDIAIDHTNGDIMIIYSDGIPGTGSDADQVWRMSRNNWFQNGTVVIPGLYWGSPDGYAIDMPPNRFMAIGSNHIAGVQNTQAYTPEGAQIFVVQQGGSHLMDVVGFCAGDFLNSLGNMKGFSYEDDKTILYRYPYDWDLNTYDWQEFKVEYYTPDSLTGIDELYYEYIVALETDGTGNYVWYLEDAPEFYASRWEIIHFPESAPHGTQVYSGAYFGTGIQSDSDESWNDSKDITRDNLNRFFVLDELSDGTPRVKMWSVEGDVTTSLVGFGDDVTIMGEPLRIEGSDWSGDVVVLHVDWTDPLNPRYMISVFIPYEMPG